MTVFRWIYLILLTLCTIGWAALLVLLSSGLIVDNPPDFSEAGVGTLLGILIGWTRNVMQHCYNIQKGS